MTIVTYNMMVSLDGYINDPEGGLEWHRLDEELLRHVNDREREYSCYVFGRRLYETMSVWDEVGDVPDEDEWIREYARIWQEKPKYIVSDTLSSVPDEFELLDGDLEEDLEAVKLTHGGKISVGGATLAGALIESDLVDEFRRYVNPVVLGGGTPYFSSDASPRELTLVETHTFDNDVILERYSV